MDHILVSSTRSGAAPYGKPVECVIIVPVGVFINVTHEIPVGIVGGVHQQGAVPVIFDLILHIHGEHGVEYLAQVEAGAFHPAETVGRIIAGELGNPCIGHTGRTVDKGLGGCAEFPAVIRSVRIPESIAGIEIGEIGTGYRLQIRIGDQDGRIIPDGLVNFIIGRDHITGEGYLGFAEVFAGCSEVGRSGKGISQGLTGVDEGGDRLICPGCTIKIRQGIIVLRLQTKILISNGNILCGCQITTVFRGIP